MNDLEYIDLEFPTEHTVAIIPRRYSNAGAIALNNFIVAIDPTMLPITGIKARKQVEKRFGLPTKYLFLTHSHGDHYFGLASFTDCVIVSSLALIQNVLKAQKEKWTPEYLNQWKEQNPDNPHLFDDVDLSILPSICFEKFVEIRDGDLTVELHYSGGHTSGSGYAYVPHEKVLFAGDLIFSKRFPFAGDPTCNPDKWIDILHKLQGYDFDKLVPGHGPVVSKSETQAYLEFFTELKDAIQAIIHQGRGVEEIDLPNFYEDQSHELRFTKATLEHWYKFYGGK